MEDPKRALLMFGNKTSQVIKDVMTDLHKLKGVSGRAMWPSPAAAAALVSLAANHMLALLTGSEI